MRLYVATTTSPRSPLPRWFRELIAVEVSRANDCSY
jgi:alkylhydroperoxidase family enzyme